MRLAIILAVLLLAGCVDPDFFEPRNYTVTYTEQNYSDDDFSGWPGVEPPISELVTYPELVEQDPNADYSFSASDEQEFFSSIQPYYDDEQFKTVRESMNRLKQNFPKGYLAVVRATLQNPTNFPIFASGFGGISVDTLVHENVHMCSAFELTTGEWHLYDYSYFLGDYNVVVKRNKAWFSKSELFSYIVEPTDFDITYLEPVPGNIDPDVMNILNELNAYSFGMETNLLYGVPDNSKSSFFQLSQRTSLLRTMHHLQLYFIVAREDHPEDWEEMVSHKGFACVVKVLWARADRLAQNTKNLDVFDTEETLAAETTTYAEENMAIMQEFFSESGCAATDLRFLSEPGAEVVTL